MAVFGKVDFFEEDSPAKDRPLFSGCRLAGTCRGTLGHGVSLHRAVPSPNHKLKHPLIYMYSHVFVLLFISIVKQCVYTYIHVLGTMFLTRGVGE